MGDGKEAEREESRATGAWDQPLCPAWPPPDQVGADGAAKQEADMKRDATAPTAAVLAPCWSHAMAGREQVESSVENNNNNNQNRMVARDHCPDPSTGLDKNGGRLADGDSCFLFTYSEALRRRADPRPDPRPDPKFHLPACPLVALPMFGPLQCGNFPRPHIQCGDEKKCSNGEGTGAWATHQPGYRRVRRLHTASRCLQKWCRHPFLSTSNRKEPGKAAGFAGRCCVLSRQE